MHIQYLLFSTLHTHMYISNDIYLIEPAIKVACSSVYLSSGGGGGGGGRGQLENKSL